MIIFIVHLDCPSSIKSIFSRTVMPKSLYSWSVKTFFIVTFPISASVTSVSSGWIAWYNCRAYLRSPNKSRNTESLDVVFTSDFWVSGSGTAVPFPDSLILSLTWSRINSAELVRSPPTLLFTSVSFLFIISPPPPILLPLYRFL